MKRIIMKYLNSEFWLGASSMISGWMLSFLAPVWPFLILIFFLTITDLYTGTEAAKKRGEKINSRGLRRSVQKITLYAEAVLLTEGCRIVFMPGVNITYIAAFTVCLTELKSNLENISTVTGTNVWTTLKHFISKKL